MQHSYGDRLLAKLYLHCCCQHLSISIAFFSPSWRCCAIWPFPVSRSGLHHSEAVPSCHTDALWPCYHKTSATVWAHSASCAHSILFCLHRVVSWSKSPTGNALARDLHCKKELCKSSLITRAGKKCSIVGMVATSLWRRRHKYFVSEVNLIPLSLEWQRNIKLSITKI